MCYLSSGRAAVTHVLRVCVFEAQPCKKYKKNPKFSITDTTTSLSTPISLPCNTIYPWCYAIISTDLAGWPKFPVQQQGTGQPTVTVQDED